ncbi:Enoyl-CoA hydratase/isomerase [Colletotrichum higginsianum IMI 349063]|uniref:Enoyl-CoA hydratase/isomerase n=2 Tax=Colletotrichum higginsianum TaxID=80884 RepID=A0A1B7YHI0_COLHI|nr:Enoyl-CoA hydratase/isomerase [Colletotrichum higginsianum IMI 349063]OBR11344.1 Enoyl-CoA hydratase/isomerase [Colletotrichum higginsianum IMI 349063]TIC99964.1 3-hydroxypropionyl-coenzyme A dehydratase [Colletotrichum higginsianum]GJC92991.1 enoyl-CoA hydratase/isomerase [Colletotrichum higginsianum]
MELTAYRSLKTSSDSGVLVVTFHNPDSPEYNFWGRDTQEELKDLVKKLDADDETKVVIFKSDAPKFFVAHLDVTILDGSDPIFIEEFAALLHSITTLRQVTIGAIEGRARGAGSEFLASLDMRFATRSPETLIAHQEICNGLIPGGGASQFLTHLVGRARALEYILTGKDINAADAEKIGWINKSFANSEEMYAYISQQTSRLRLFPLTALHEIKKAVNRHSVPSREDIVSEGTAFRRQYRDPQTQAVLTKTWEVLASIPQMEAELDLPSLVPQFYE